MSSLRYVLAVFRACIVFAWAGTAAATTIVLAQSAVITLDPLLMLLTCAISTLAGVTALAIRTNNLLMADEGKPLVRPWLYAASHMCGSWMAGSAGFLVGRINGWDVWTSLFGVLMLSFAGAKGLELLAERWLAVVRLPGGDKP